jgi:hypothetical protein
LEVVVEHKEEGPGSKVSMGNTGIEGQVVVANRLFAAGTGIVEQEQESDYYL